MSSFTRKFARRRVYRGKRPACPRCKKKMRWARKNKADNILFGTHVWKCPYCDWERPPEP